MLGSTDTLEIPFHHNSEPCRKSFSFLHRVGCQDNSGVVSLSGNSGNYLPHESSGFWIHSSWWFIQEDDSWISDHGHGNRKLTFVASWESAWQFISILSQIHLFYFFIDGLFFVISTQRLHIIEEFELFLYTQIINEGIKLRTIAQSLADFVQVIANFKTVEVTVSSSWSYLPGQHLECRGFTSSVYSQ